MKFDRSSGILLHPTSLPGPYGIGDLSLNARKWIDFLGEAGCALWQVLPLGPTGYGDSPYQCFSAFAGNPYLISPDILHADGFLDGDDFDFPPPFPPGHVDYGQVIQWKLSILDRAYDHFQARATATLMAEYEKFQFEKASWLDDFALFMMLKEMHGGAAWVTWSEPYRKRDPQALDKAKQANSHIYNRQVFRQFIFFRQLHSLREYIADKGTSREHYQTEAGHQAQPHFTKPTKLRLILLHTIKPPPWILPQNKCARIGWKFHL